MKTKVGKKGFTLVEMAIVLAVSSIALVMFFTLADAINKQLINSKRMQEQQTEAEEVFYCVNLWLTNNLVTNTETLKITSDEDNKTFVLTITDGAAEDAVTVTTLTYDDSVKTLKIENGDMPDIYREYSFFYVDDIIFEHAGSEMLQIKTTVTFEKTTKKMVFLYTSRLANNA